MQSIERTLVIWVFLTLTAGVALAASESPTWLPAPPDVLEQLDLDRGDLQKIDVSAAGPALHANVRLGGETFGLVLHRVSLRGDHFEVLVPGVDGTLRPVEVPAPQTYQGYLEGSVSGRVAASWSGTELTALILLDDGSAWAVQPAPGRPGWSVVYVSEDVRDGDWHCGNDLLPQIEQSGQPAPPTTSGIGDKVCQIAFDADREFWAKNGSSVSATVNDIENILNGVVTVYERDVNITYELSTIIVRTSEPDPYSSSDAGTLLDQFENYWAANHGGIHRDIAHLMTGKNINGGTIGVAWVGTICSGPRSYGLSESRFTSNFNRRVTLTAHELGHNWSAPHCNGDGDCHIMCSGLGGCNGIGLPNFGINSAAQIISFSNSTSCTPSEPAPASIATPFFETWDDVSQPDGTDWTFNQGAFVLTTAVAEPNAPKSIQMSTAGGLENDKEEIRSKTFALQGESGVTLSFYTEARGPENGESLICDYVNSSGDWVELGRVNSDGTIESSFLFSRFSLPANAYHDGFRFRFRTDVDDIFDFWFVDSVKLGKQPEMTLVTPPSPGQTARADVTGLLPGQSVTLFYSFTGIGSGPCFFQDVCFDLLGGIFPLVTINANGAGTASFLIPIPANAPIGLTAYLQAFAGYVPGRQSDVSTAVSATVQ